MTTWTKIPSPSNATHTITAQAGTPIGLLMALTYATTSSVISGIWIDINKASGTNWTKINKAT